MKKTCEIGTFVREIYQLEVLNVTTLTDKVFKIATPKKDFLLKFFVGDDDFLMKQLYAHKELPEVVLPIYETKDGQRIATDGTVTAYLTDYVAQIPMPFENRVRDYAALLEKLHQKTAITADKNDDEINWMYATDYQQLEENYQQLEQMATHYEMKLSRSPFEWQLLMMYPLLYGMYRRSDEAMKKFYRLLGRKKQLPIAMTHGDVNVSNVLAHGAHTHLINFENSTFDLPTRDMLQFLSHYHSSKGTRQMLADYLKNQKDQLLVHYFFMKSLCIDLKKLNEHLSGNALVDISLLNEKLAPGLIAMGIYDQMNGPKPPQKKATKKEVTDTSEK